MVVGMQGVVIHMAQDRTRTLALTGVVNTLIQVHTQSVHQLHGTVAAATVERWHNARCRQIRQRLARRRLQSVNDHILLRVDQL